ncbi:hypothetical protein [Cohnella sp.]|uniref:hypothetical protein n=1 Tax=Cohnella sp. TaxID=1883426 RepID=UPI00356B26CC
MIAIVIWLIGMVIFFFILFNVIQHALNTSEMAKDLSEIKRLLREQAASRSTAAPPAPRDIAELRKVYDRCPGCGHAVQAHHLVCPDCGLRLT